MNRTIALQKAVSGSKRGFLSAVLAALLLLASFWMNPPSASASNSPAVAASSSSSRLTMLEEPTVVWVDSFHAERNAGGDVQLSWTTAIGMDAIGFYLYREDPQVVKNEPINTALIFAGSGELTSDNYTFIDTNAEPGAIGDYWLEVIRGTREPLICGPAEKITEEILLYLPAIFIHVP